MKKITIHSITINNKKYEYKLKPVSKDVTMFICDAARIKQDFLNEDIPALLVDLPELIESEKNYDNNQTATIRFRVSAEDKSRIQIRAFTKGYSSVSSYLRDVSLGK